MSAPQSNDQHPLTPQLRALCGALQLAGLDCEVQGFHRRGRAHLRTGDTVYPANVRTTPTARGTHLRVFSDAALWTEGLVTADGVSDVQINPAHPYTGAALHAALNGYVTGQAGDIPAPNGRIIPYMTQPGGWICLDHIVPELAPLEDLERHTSTLATDAGYHVIQRNIMTNGRDVIVGPVGQRYQLRFSELKKYHTLD